MSSFEGLCIQGLRSFGPDDRDQQRLDFVRPLTVITGPNGSGKTTIVECLKYAASGSFPPGVSAGGRFFVHDPQLLGATRVDASTKLHFRDITGHRCAATRRLQAIVKPKSTQYKSEEANLVIEKQNGEKKKISSKVADLNKEMFKCLGVSEAILENVVFCHQEEANWPLSAPSDLKKKFDAIFSATRYIEALDKMKKIQKEKTIDLKTVETELTYLESDKKEKRRLEIERNSIEKDVEKCQKNLEVVEREAKPLNEQLDKVDEQLLQHRSTAGKIGELEGLKTANENIASRKHNDLRKAGVHVYETKEEVNGEIQKLTFDDDERQDEKNMLDTQLESVDMDMRNLNKDHLRLTQNQGKLQKDVEHLQRRRDDRDSRIKTAAQDNDLSGFSGTSSISEPLLKRFNAAMHDKITHYSDKEDDIESTNSRMKMDDLNNRMKIAMDERSTARANVLLKERQIEENNDLLRLSERKLESIHGSHRRLKQLEDQLVVAEEELNSELNEVDENEIRKELEKLHYEEGTAKGKTETLQKELFKAQKEEEKMTKLRLKETEHNKVLADLKSFQSQYQKPLHNIFGSKPHDQIKETVSDFLAVKSGAIGRCEEEVRELESKVDSRKRDGHEFQKKLNAEREEMDKCRTDIERKIGDDSLEDKLNDLSLLMEQNQKERGTLGGAKFMYEKYINKIISNTCCPLCQRRWENKFDADQLVNRLNTMIDSLPQQISVYDQRVMENQETYTMLVELRRVAEKLDNSKTEIAELEANVDHCSVDIAEDEEMLEKAKSKLTQLRRERDMYKSLEGDASLMDKLIHQMSDLDREIKKIRAEISSDINVERTLTLIQQEFKCAQDILKRIDRELGMKRKVLENHQKKVNAGHKEVNDLKTQIHKIKDGMQEYTTLKQKVSDLKNTIQKLEDDVCHARKSIGPLENEVSKLKEEEEQLNFEKRSAMKRIGEKRSKIQHDLERIDELTKEIGRLEDEDNEIKLEQCERDVERLTEKVEKLNKKKEVLNTSLEQIKEEIRNKEIRRRHLRDNLELLGARELVELKKREIEELEATIGGVRTKHLENKRGSIVEKRNELLQKSGQINGRKVELKNRLNATNEKLLDKKYSEVDTKHLKNKIKLLTTKEALKDLKKYSNVLDTAILQHHSTQMESINRHLRQLWEKIYVASGASDIEYIEIKSEPTEEKSDKRRAYNYRVVMHIEGSDVEMRSRCSAGQRVLACILIRLALAEVFCYNCGMIALDEPTTNLDLEKTNKLADALATLVEDRSGQNNFQLVVITHDEHFVQHLSTQCRPEKLYLVNKNDRGFTVLQSLDPRKRFDRGDSDN